MKRVVCLTFIKEGQIMNRTKMKSTNKQTNKTVGFRRKKHKKDKLHSFEKKKNEGLKLVSFRMGESPIFL